jgi:hypothetical protein
LTNRKASSVPGRPIWLLLTRSPPIHRSTAFSRCSLPPPLSAAHPRSKITFLPSLLAAVAEVFGHLFCVGPSLLCTAHFSQCIWLCNHRSKQNCLSCTHAFARGLHSSARIIFLLFTHFLTRNASFRRRHLHSPTANLRSNCVC